MLIDDFETFKFHYLEGSKKTIKLPICSKEKMDFFFKLQQDKFSKVDFILLIIKAYINHDRRLISLIREEQKRKKTFSTEVFKKMKKNDKKVYSSLDNYTFGEEGDILFEEE